MKLLTHSNWDIIFQRIITLCHQKKSNLSKNTVVWFIIFFRFHINTPLLTPSIWHWYVVLTHIYSLIYKIQKNYFIRFQIHQKIIFILFLSFKFIIFIRFQIRMLLRWRNSCQRTRRRRLRRKPSMFGRKVRLLSGQGHFCSRPEQARLLRMSGRGKTILRGKKKIFEFFGRTVKNNFENLFHQYLKRTQLRVETCWTKKLLNKI